MFFNKDDEILMFSAALLFVVLMIFSFPNVFGLKTTMVKATEIPTSLSDY